VTARQANETARITRETVGLQMWLELKREWDSPYMQERKRQAAFLLLVEKPEKGTAVGTVLDFFETVALLFNREIVDRHFVWYTFG
jgi:hypothetical protein